jgi:probable F420-dependent oxidoreductase
VKFGLALVNQGYGATAEGAHVMARAAEESGFESVWTAEHVVVPAGYESNYPYGKSGRMASRDDFDIPDPYIWLAYVAGLTTTLRLATGVSVLPLRNSLVLAKQVATLDALSGGRMILGVGTGWLEEEFDAVGVPFRRRGAATDDAIKALRALWEQDPATYHGSHHDFDDVYVRPRPIQTPVPIVIGGHSERAARRAGELGDGFYPASAQTEDLPGLVALAREHAERAGRDPEALEITRAVRPDPERVEREVRAGVDRVVFVAFDPDSVRRIGDAMTAAFG